MIKNLGVFDTTTTGGGTGFCYPFVTHMCVQGISIYTYMHTHSRMCFFWKQSFPLYNDDDDDGGGGVREVGRQEEKQIKNPIRMSIAY